MKYAACLVLLVSTMWAMDNKRLKGTNTEKAIRKENQSSLNDIPLRHKTIAKMSIKSEKPLIDKMGMLSINDVDCDYLRTTKSDSANILPIPARREVNS